MSAAMDSSTNAQKVFVELLDEATTCLRPTLAEPLGGDKYRLLPTHDYDAGEEHWAFPPGSIVRCRRERLSGGEALVAREGVDEA